MNRVCFKDAISIKYAYGKGTLLENILVRDLLNTGNGSGKNYSGLNMKGAFLESADLTNADLSETDISGAILRNASLKNASLNKTQCLDTDFSGADFTSACLESWNIDSTTCLKGAYAEYVYLLSNLRERRPNSGIFLENEFCKLFQEILNTVDFIFNNGIDWQAFMVSFDKIREQIKIHSESDNELSVQSIENKGEGVFVVKVNVPPDIDKEQIHEHFSQDYQQQLALIENRFQAKLEMKDTEIARFREHNTDLKQIIHSLANRPIRDQYNVSGDAVIGNEQGILKKQTFVSNENLKDEISALKAEISKLTCNDTKQNELDIHLSTLENQSLLNQPSATIVNSCLESISNILQGAAGNAVFDIIQRIGGLF